MVNCPQISFIIFIWYCLYYCNLNQAIEKLCENYKLKNFYFRFLWKKIYILREDLLISKLLSQEEVDLTYIQNNFNSIHGHSQTINGYNSKDVIWNILHKGLKSSLLSFGELESIMTKHLHILYSESPKVFMVSERLEEYILRVWSEFSYGPSVDYYEYRNCRNKIINLLKRDFHGSYLVKLPIIGNLYCRYNYWRRRYEYDAIDNHLWRLASSGIYDDGFIKNFHQCLRDEEIIKNKGKVIIDNSYLLFLVADFLHKVLLDYLLRVSVDINEEGENVEEIQFDKLFKVSLNKGFLYPYRYRYTNASIELAESLKIAQGSIIIYDLKESHLYFSSGPRSCIGQGLVRKVFYEYFTNKILKNKYLLLNSNNIEYNGHDYNVPELKIHHIGQWKNIKKSDADLLSKMKCYDGHRGVKYYNILNLYNDPEICHYLVNDITNKIVELEEQCDGIIGVETRGLSLAGMIAYKLHLPLFTIRKEGKLPGGLYCIKYKTAYSEDEVQLCREDPISNKKVVVIDDGIASGGTSLACIKLVELAGGRVIQFITMVNHTYRPRIKEYSEYEKITYSCFTIPS